jgi:uncharacterized protein (TIGR02466 family)
MPVEILPLFSTPIYLSDTGVITFEEEVKFLEEIQYNRGVHNDLSKDIKLLDLPELKRVRSICELHLKKYIDTVINCKQEFYITNSWATKNSKGEHHHVHDHPNSIMSGVIYLQVPDPENAIEFHHKSAIKNNFYFYYNVREFNIFNSDTWFLPIKQGQILLFPSWVRHGVNSNNSEKDRIVLGFNTFVKGNFEGEIYSADLELL